MNMPTTQYEIIAPPGPPVDTDWAINVKLHATM